jgi:hypothetical protein
MTGPGIGLLAAVVAAVIPMETLLFTAIDEQQHDTDCAQAVIESIAAEFWMTAIAVPRDSGNDDFRMTIGEIHALLSRSRIENRAFWMSWDEVIRATARFGPAIVHFDRPTGHFAVAVGGIVSSNDDQSSSPGARRSVEHMLIADPARGDVIVSRAWWGRHASGATVIVDVPWDQDERSHHIEAATARFRRLEAAGDAINVK